MKKIIQNENTKMTEIVRQHSYDSHIYEKFENIFFSDFTLSTWANKPSWLLCLVVSLTSSFAWDVSCSNKEPWELCRWDPADPSDGGWLPLPEPVEPELDVRAKTLPTLGCFTKFGDIGGACNEKNNSDKNTDNSFSHKNPFCHLKDKKF